MKQYQNEIINKDEGHLELINSYNLGQQYVDQLHYSSEHSILLMRIGRKINVFIFNELSLKLIGSFLNSREYFSNIFSMNKQNVIISGDSTGKCKLFQLSNLISSRYLYLLQGHNGCISYIDMNDQESDLVTSSVNSTIKFWNKRNIWCCYQTIIQHQDLLLGFSLNNSGNQLVSYGFDDYVLVIQKVKNKQIWQVIQKISDRLFKAEGQLTSPKEKDLMIVYSNEVNQNFFQQTAQIKLWQGSSSLDCLSKIQFVRSNLVLVQKLDKIISCLKLNLDGDVISQEYIDISKKKFVAYMSQDANYLFIANCDSYQLQIRKNFGF
ncbi:unnamed protein product [Paramecium octaurelia]|uniref:Uncharacterized protein n=1 Tax=Paramecium octaurelia TaxID=43137 RepID=A0A8S1W757_PAROT|nr:unnamed protein product [Paramecium octaurelia]